MHFPIFLFATEQNRLAAKRINILSSKQTRRSINMYTGCTRDLLSTQWGVMSLWRKPNRSKVADSIYARGELYPKPKWYFPSGISPSLPRQKRGNELQKRRHWEREIRLDMGSFHKRPVFSYPVLPLSPILERYIFRTRIRGKTCHTRLQWQFVSVSIETIKSILATRGHIPGAIYQSNLRSAK